MADQVLLERLDQLHKEQKNREILAEMAKLPPEEQKEYQLQSRLGRALGNLGRHRDALRVLEALAEEGENDPLWWYRMGCAWYCLAETDRAEEQLRRALELDPDCQGAHEVMLLIQKLRRRENNDSKKKGNKKEGETVG